MESFEEALLRGDEWSTTREVVHDVQRTGEEVLDESAPGRGCLFVITCRQSLVSSEKDFATSRSVSTALSEQYGDLAAKSKSSEPGKEARSHLLQHGDKTNEQGKDVRKNVSPQQQQQDDKPVSPQQQQHDDKPVSPQQQQHDDKPVSPQQQQHDDKPVSPQQQQHDDKPVSPQQQQHDDKPVSPQQQQHDDKPVSPQQQQHDDKPVSPQQQQHDDKPVSPQQQQHDDKPVSPQQQQHDDKPVSPQQQQHDDKPVSPQQQQHDDKFVSPRTTPQQTPRSPKTPASNSGSPALQPRQPGSLSVGSQSLTSPTAQAGRANMCFVVWASYSYLEAHFPHLRPKPPRGQRKIEDVIVKETPEGESAMAGGPIKNDAKDKSKEPQRQKPPREDKDKRHETRQTDSLSPRTAASPTTGANGVIDGFVNDGTTMGHDPAFIIVRAADLVKLDVFASTLTPDTKKKYPVTRVRLRGYAQEVNRDAEEEGGAGEGTTPRRGGSAQLTSQASLPVAAQRYVASEDMVELNFWFLRGGAVHFVEALRRVRPDLTRTIQLELRGGVHTACDADTSDSASKQKKKQKGRADAASGEEDRSEAHRRHGGAQDAAGKDSKADGTDKPEGQGTSYVERLMQRQRQQEAQDAQGWWRSMANFFGIGGGAAEYCHNPLPGFASSPSSAPDRGHRSGADDSRSSINGKSNNGSSSSNGSGNRSGGYSAQGQSQSHSGSSFVDLSEDVRKERSIEPMLPPIHRPIAMPLTAEVWRACFEDTTPATNTITSGITAATAKSNEDNVQSDATKKHGAKGVRNAARFEEARLIAYRGGIDPAIRLDVWCHLLNVYAAHASEAERAAVRAANEKLYDHLSLQWRSILPEQEAHFELFHRAKSYIEKDVVRTNRSHPAFRDDDAAKLGLLRHVLLAHLMLNLDLGYRQGMDDVLAVVALLTESESMAFLCFRFLMHEQLMTGFSSDAQKGMPRKLMQVRLLVRHFCPHLYAHLRRLHAEDMVFCFPWLLTMWKREFTMEETMLLWDVILACPYTRHFDVLVTVGVLKALSRQVQEQVHSHEQLMRFVHRLSGNLSVQDVIGYAHKLYDEVCSEVTLSRDGLSESAFKLHTPSIDETVELLLRVDGPLEAASTA